MGVSPAGGLRSLWITVDGRRVHARVSTRPVPPEAVPVVLVHGLGMSGRYMVPTAEQLAGEFPVYAPDLPGHGRSDKPRHTLNVQELAGALLAWMDSVALPRAALLGNSLGCQIIAELARRSPHRVDRLILVGPTADPAARSTRRQIARMLITGRAERPGIGPLALLEYWRAGPRRISQEIRFMLEHRIEDTLPLLTAPVMVVRGARDAIVPQRWAEEVARLARAERLIVIPGWGHAVNYSAPLELARVIRPFLQAGSRSGGQPRPSVEAERMTADTIRAEEGARQERVSA